MAQRLYQDFNIDIDKIEDSELKELLLHIGQLYNISGLLLQGNEKTFLVVFPTACKLDSEWVMNIDTSTPKYGCWDLSVNDIFEPSFQELQEILKRSDDPLIFEQDETGVLKAIVRKSQRVVSGANQQKIWFRDGFQCLYCGQSAPDVQVTVDHFVPVERGGEDNPGNYVTSCRRCNKNKGNKDPEEYCKKYNLDYRGIQLYLEGKAPKNFIAHLRK